MKTMKTNSIPPALRSIEHAARRPTLCFVVRNDENKTGGMIVPQSNLPAESSTTQIQRAEYEEWQGMSARKMFKRGMKHARKDEYAEAAKWFRRAAEQGHAIAQNNLGELYSGGVGIPQDEFEAVKWFRCAAEQGLAQAQFALGSRYYGISRLLRKLTPLAPELRSFGDFEITQDIPTNHWKAYIWLSLAAENGMEDAKVGQSMAAIELSPAELSLAQEELIHRRRLVGGASRFRNLWMALSFILWK